MRVHGRMHATAGSERAPRYVPLVYRVAGVNAGLLVAVVLVTMLVLDPHKLGRVALDEAFVLAAALTLVGVGNLVVLRRVVAPLAALTELARHVDLTRPGTRMPDAAPRVLVAMPPHDEGPWWELSNNCADIFVRLMTT